MKVEPPGRRPEADPEDAYFGAGRHQSKQRPVETRMLAKFRRTFAEIATDCAAPLCRQQEQVLI